MNSSYIDISFPISNKLPKWPGSVGFNIDWHMTMPDDTNNLSSFSIDSHLGTHLDAPLHFVNEGKSIENLDLNKLIGETYVLEIRNIKSITYQVLEKSCVPTNCKKLLIKTDNQFYWESELEDFQEDFASIDSTGAKWIIERGIHLVGIDYLSIQRFYDGPETHQILLENEVVIVETLDLRNVDQGWFELICLPMKIKGLEGSPVRAILKPILNEKI